jgi:putative transcription factor
MLQLTRYFVDTSGADLLQE